MAWLRTGKKAVPPSKSLDHVSSVAHTRVEHLASGIVPSKMTIEMAKDPRMVELKNVFLLSDIILWLVSLKKHHLRKVALGLYTVRGRGYSRMQQIADEWMTNRRLLHPLLAVKVIRNNVLLPLTFRTTTAPIARTPIGQIVPFRYGPLTITSRTLFGLFLGFGVLCGDRMVVMVMYVDDQGLFFCASLL